MLDLLLSRGVDVGCQRLLGDEKRAAIAAGGQESILYGTADGATADACSPGSFRDAQQWRCRVLDGIGFLHWGVSVLGIICFMKDAACETCRQGPDTVSGVCCVTCATVFD